MLQVHPKLLNVPAKNLNFKSHIVKNDTYDEAMKIAKTDLSYVGNLNRGLLTLKSLQGIADDKKHDFVEFIRDEKNVYTKVNGAVDPKYTIKSKGPKMGVCEAIINYAMKNNSCSQLPLTRSEEVVSDIKVKLEMAEATMRKDMLRILEYYV